MSQLEFSLVAVSILIALVVAKLIEGLYQAILGRLWWVHTAWLLNRFVAALLPLWGLSPSRRVDAGAGRFAEKLESFGAMTFLMLGPIILLLSSMLLVSDRPAQVTDWRAHFELVRRPFLSLLLVAISLNGIFGFLVGAPVSVVVYLFMIAAAVAGLVWSSARVQAGVVIAHSGVLLLGVVRALYQ